jgi:hypothetical protein
LDIDGWLGGIGLAQYAGIFRADDIDGGLLGQLANDDLKDIGVASFGHRKKILEAIAALAAATDAATPIPAAAAVRKPPDGPTAAASRSFSATSSARRACRQRSTPRIGAISSTAISTRRPRRLLRWAGMSRKSSAT